MNNSLDFVVGILCRNASMHTLNGTYGEAVAWLSGHNSMATWDNPDADLWYKFDQWLTRRLKAPSNYVGLGVLWRKYPDDKQALEQLQRLWTEFSEANVEKIRAENEEVARGRAVLEELWEEFKNTPFPDEFQRRRDSGINFVLLNRDVADAVRAFLEGGPLSVAWVALLGLRYCEVHGVLDKLNTEERAYWQRVERMAKIVLTLMSGYALHSG